MFASPSTSVGFRSQANSAQIRQSAQDSGLVFEASVLETFQVVPSSIGSGRTIHKLTVWVSGTNPSTLERAIVALQTGGTQADCEKTVTDATTGVIEFAIRGVGLSLGPSHHHYFPLYYTHM